MRQRAHASPVTTKRKLLPFQSLTTSPHERTTSESAEKLSEVARRLRFVSASRPVAIGRAMELIINGLAIICMILKVPDSKNRYHPLMAVKPPEAPRGSSVIWTVCTNNFVFIPTHRRLRRRERGRHRISKQDDTADETREKEDFIHPSSIAAGS